jgi:hypothetical protein
VDYVVTAGLEPPVEAKELDALQREGVAALLDRQLGQVEGVLGPDDQEIDVLDYRITVHPDGTTVVLALDAPSLIAAEEGAATVLHELLAETDLLAGWTVSDSEVRITEDEFNQSLAAATRGALDDAGRSDDAEAALEAAIEEALEGSESGEDEPALDTERWREKLKDAATHLRAFDPTTFTSRTNADPEQGVLAAGAVVHAVRVVTDELFYDELALAVNNATADEAVGLLVLEELPPCYEHHYDSLFARAFLLASAAVASRLAETNWGPPRCVAEALALKLIVNEARVVLEAAELIDWEASERLFAAFTDLAFADTDHEELYAVEQMLSTEESEVANQQAAEVDAKLRERGLAFDQWFSLRGGWETADGLHPYLGSL